MLFKTLKFPKVKMQVISFFSMYKKLNKFLGNHFVFPYSIKKWDISGFQCPISKQP